MKKKNLSLLIIILLLSFDVQVEAAVVSTTFNTPTEPLAYENLNYFRVAKLLGNISITVYKTINFKLPDNAIAGNQSTLNIGQSIVLNENTTTADWFTSGAHTDSPPADGFRYSLTHNEKFVTDKGIQVAVSVPIDKSLPIISSSNTSVLECINNQSCIARNPGSAIITVSFPQKNNSTSIRSLLPQRDYGFGLINLQSYDTNYKIRNIFLDTNVSENTDTVSRPYSFPSITYKVTVSGAPNTPQVSTCTGATAITKDSATVNWSYTDVDNDPQTQYQVQLSTKSFIDPTFSTSTDVGFSASNASANTSHTFTGLTPNTTYYSRVKTYNTVNGWSTVYSTCNTGFKTSEDQNTTQPTCSCNPNNRDYICKDTAGTVISTETNSSQCAFTTYCSPTTTDDKVTFTFGPAGHRIGGVKYEHSGDTPVTKTGPYDYSHSYTVNKVEGTQTFTTTLTDLYDNTTSPRTCSMINTAPESCISQPCNTTITIKKTPAITLNKGGTCTLEWTITERSPGMTCTLTGTDSSQSLTLLGSSGVHTSLPLYQNTKYTISCTSDTPPTTLSKSVICRINPSIGEI